MAKPSQLPYLAGLLGQQGAVALANVSPVIIVDINGNPVSGATNAPALLILDELQNQPNYSEQVILDTGIYPSVPCVRRVVYDVATTSYIVSYTELDGSPYVPTGGLLPAGRMANSISYEYNAVTATADFAVGDVVINVSFYDPMGFVVTGGFWYNAKTGLYIAAPSLVNLRHVLQNTATKTVRIRTLASTNAALVQAGRTLVSKILLNNTTNQVRFLKIFNKATAPVTGVDTPLYVIALSSSLNTDVSFSPPIELPLGFGIAFTQNNSDLDNTAVAAGQFVGNINYV